MNKNQRSKKELIERRKRQHRHQVGGTSLPKDLIASVVHEAVCEFTGDDGFGHCAHYAVAGAKLLSLLTRKLYMPQAGDLQVFCDGDRGMMMDASLGGFGTGEFHTWIVGPVATASGPKLKTGEMTIIDFSSRHYRKWVETRPVFVDGRQVEWRLPDPPQFIWSPIGSVPKWFRVRGNKAATLELLDKLNDFSVVMETVMEKWHARKK